MLCSVERDHLVVGEDGEHEVLLLDLLAEVGLQGHLLLNAELLEKIGCAGFEVGGVLLHVIGHSSHVLIVGDSSEVLFNVVGQTEAEEGSLELSAS